MQNKNFSEFVGQYEISKTLRFELKATDDKTKDLLEENQVFEKDETIKKAYDKIKPFLDKLHFEFINESLKNSNIDFFEAYEKFLEIEKSQDKKEKIKLTKEFDKIKNSLRKQITINFKKTWESWKNFFSNKIFIDEKGKEKKYSIKWDSYKILMSETNLNILYQKFDEKIYWEEILVEDENWKKQNIFKIFKGFTTYFTNFNHSRENFYKDDWKSGRIATRIIDENMIFFFKNKYIFEKNYKNNLDLKEKLQKILVNYWEKLEDFFELKNYNNCFTWESIDYFNKIIWGKNLDDWKKIKWLNEIINLEKQANFSEYKQGKKAWEELAKFNKNNFLVFKEFYKQILSEKEEENIFIEIENLNDLKKNLKELIEKNNSKNNLAKNLIKNFIEKKDDYDFEKIFLAKLSLNTISSKFFGSWKWNLINEKLLDLIWVKNSNNKKDLPDFISLENIKKALEKAQIESEENIFKKEFDEITINNVFEKFLQIFEDEFFNLISENEKNKKDLEEKILILENLDKEEKNKEKQIEIIKNYLDVNLNIYRMMKYFALEKGKENVETKYEIDDYFYNEFKNFYIYNEIINYYNAFRNYLTKKPYSQDKIKLNFENGTLLDGWDKNKEPDNFGTLLKKDWKYYLALQVYWKQNIFYKKKWSSAIDIEEAYKIENWEDFFEKIDYKFFPDAAKMIPKCSTQLNIVKNHFKNNSEDIVLKRWKNIKLDSNIIKSLRITKNIFDLNNYEYSKKYLAICWNNIDLSNRLKADSKKTNQVKLFQKDFFILTWNTELYKSSLIEWINFCKDFLKSYSSTSDFELSFKKSEDYNSLDEFYEDIDKSTYSIKIEKKVSQNYIFENINAWNIYLFEIYNKDFAEWKTGKSNLHTMYFKWLFEENNLKNIVLKLNWQAEIFRRKASLKEKKKIITKKKNIEIKKEKWEIFHNKRYTENKLFFHCPIKLNFAKHNEKINQKILNYISDNKEINIIWIDRWEKHLAYYSIIDRNWNVLKDKEWKLVKWSFNEIWWKNYYEELVKRENERKEARWSWKTIWTIKELKEGYISQVVHKLAELIIKYNTIIVFEDLNSWFKRWRQKIERQVYQKLEKALIEKLNYLTFKDKNYWEKGHFLEAYQLTAPFTTFKDMWKQTWAIFYTNPAYTSATCPSCGFRKDLYIKYSNFKKAKEELKKIDKFYFENDKFIFEYNNLKINTDKARKRNISSEESWVKWWKTIDNDITKNLENILEKNNINYKTWENLIEKIIEKNDKALYKEIFYNFSAITTIRNSTIWDNSESWDFISCPVCDFDSRFDNKIWVSSWDDNWAFNIARKWIIILNKIDKFKKEKWNLEKIKWSDLFVNGDNWDEFVSVEK